MTTSSAHPLSGYAKAWPVPDFSLESRRPKASATLPVGLFSLGAAAAPTTHETLKHPDEEKGRSLRSGARSASSSGLFESSDAANRSPSVAVIQPCAGLPLNGAAASLDGADDEDDSFLDSWLSGGGARAEATDETASPLPSRNPEPPQLAWMPSTWSTAVDKAVMNANGCIQLSGNRLDEIPSLVSDLANLRAFEPRISSSPFARTQSSPAAAFNLRCSNGRTSSGSFGPNTFSRSSPTAVPVELHLGNNDITVEAISHSLWTLANLHVLSLRQNRLESLPPGIGRLENLHTLNVASNQLRYLPAEIKQLPRLAIVNLHPNPWLPPPILAEPASPSLPAATDSSEEQEAPQLTRRRRRVLGPATVHFRLPSLKEVAIRRLLSAAEWLAPELAQPLVKELYTMDSLRSEKVPDHLLALFSTTFKQANSASSGSFARGRQVSASSTLSASSSSGSTAAPFDPLSHICRSPAHPDEARVFFEPAVERFEWVSEQSLKPAAVQQPSKRSSEVRNIPIRWRGCGATCLDWLEEDEPSPELLESA